MKRYFSCLCVSWLLLAMPLRAGSARIYSLNIDGASVTVIDPETNKVVDTITGIPWPRGASFSPDGSRAYICSEEEHTLDVVDTKTDKIVQKVHLSGHPSGSLVTTKDGRYVLVPMNPFYGLALQHHDPDNSGGVDVVDTASLARIKTIPMKEAVHDLFRTPDGKYALAGSATADFITIIDLQTLEPVGKIPLEGVPLTMAVDGSSSRVFTEIKKMNGFAVVDLAERKAVAKIDFPDTIRFAFAALTNKARGAEEGVTATEYNPTHGTDVTPDGKTLWVCSRGTNRVYVYSLPDLKLVGHVSLPVREKTAESKPDAGDPHWMVFAPDGKAAYICLARFNEVIAIDVKTLQAVAEIPVGKDPKMIVATALP
jgi:YVTN family beta-propeller protein